MHNLRELLLLDRNITKVELGLALLKILNMDGVKNCVGIKRRIREIRR